MFNEPNRRFIPPAASALVLASMWAMVVAEEPEKTTGGLHEPVYRVTKQESPRTTTTSTALVTPATAVPLKPHPLDPALEMAQSALKKCRGQIRDYTAVLVKRERVGGRLNDPQYMLAKIRNGKLGAGNKVETPFGVYLHFLKPGSIKGREVIYVEGQNKGKLIAHEGGLKGRFTPAIHLDPHGTLAMMGQRYPIMDIGIENLCLKLLERGTRDRKRGMCVVNVQPTSVNRRAATRIEVVHPEKKPHLDFHIARIYVDDQYEVPVRYEAYDWPRSGKNGVVSEDELIEEYTYVRLKFNVGLTDADFDPKNPNYNMD